MKPVVFLAGIVNIVGSYIAQPEAFSQLDQRTAKVFILGIEIILKLYVEVLPAENFDIPFG
jgi:hypothetical protein